MFHWFLWLLIGRVLSELNRLQGWNYINLHCRDNNNKPVDWWYLYKPPLDSGSKFKSGQNYSFITPDTVGKWQPSDMTITSESMVRNTLSPMFRPTYTDHLATLVYHSRAGQQHTPGSAALGIILADELGGLWLGHTIPGFPNLTSERLTFPTDELSNGHMMMCLSLELPTLNNLADMIRIVEPNILRLHVPDRIKTALPKWKNLYRPIANPGHSKAQIMYDFMTTSGQVRVSAISRQPGDTRCLYKTFAKHNKIILDVYNHDLKTSNVCEADYSIRDIEKISLKFPEDVYYINCTADRSGFAVSMAHQEQYWTCTSTMENEDTLGKGGLIFCIEDYDIWRTFDTLKIKDPEC